MRGLLKEEGSEIKKTPYRQSMAEKVRTATAVEGHIRPHVDDKGREARISGHMQEETSSCLAVPAGPKLLPQSLASYIEAGLQERGAEAQWSIWVGFAKWWKPSLSLDSVQ